MAKPFTRDIHSLFIAFELTHYMLYNNTYWWSIDLIPIPIADGS